MKIEPEFCRVEDALGILVGKWKPIILLHLLKNVTQRFSELKRSVPGITQKMLTNVTRLRRGRYYSADCISTSSSKS
jgi:DNA-binding HxlR family transcriptional regulator